MCFKTTSLKIFASKNPMKENLFKEKRAQCTYVEFRYISSSIAR